MSRNSGGNKKEEEDIIRNDDEGPPSSTFFVVRFPFISPFFISTHTCSRSSALIFYSKGDGAVDLVVHGQK